MNKHVLFVMRSLDNPELFTQAEKEANKNSALTVYADADCAKHGAPEATYAAYAAYTAAIYTAYDGVDTATATATATTATAEYWVNEFFERSGEDKQTYINEVERSGEDKQTYIDEVERLKEDKTMNKHILFVMRSLDNPELFTQEEKEVNRKSAHATYSAAVAAYAGSGAAAEAAAAAVAAEWAAEWAEYWVNKFFKRAGEDKQTYIDEVERLKGDNNMHYDEQREAAMKQQVGGTHYKDLGVQPLELTLKNMGLLAFEGACYTKINKYMIRNKDNKVEQLKKAQHVLSMWIEEAEKQQ